ncbi:MAG: hypothetical protein H6813_07795 [Phycisphaeraceae bacterium]|nr:hypothetical protein [Phycisphaeraceae bacterium]MCB9848398.1 hypothetical protein [Phycisphaeraceae bacterium]
MSTPGDRPPITVATLTSGLLWPKLWRTLPMATRPGRLIVSFVMLVVLLVLGSAYDLVAGPVVPGAGLDADMPPAERVQANLRRIITSADAIDGERAASLLAEETIKPRRVIVAIQDSFKDRAATILRDAQSPVTTAEWDRIRTPYSSAIRDVELLRGSGLFETAAGNTARAFNEVMLGAVSLEPARSTRAAHWWWTRTVVPMFTKHTLGSVLILVLTALLLGVFGGAVARSSACDIAGWPAPGPGESVAFAWRRRADFSMTLLGPALFIGAIALVLAAIGAVALRIPGIDFIGAIFYGLALLLGLLAALSVLGLCLGGVMLIPSVAVECSDWLDGAQRVYAYVAGSPGRLVMYLVALLTQGALAYWALSLVFALTLNFTAGTVTGWLGAEPTALAGRVEPFVFQTQPDQWALGGTTLWTAHVMGLWEQAFTLLLAAGVFSYLFTGGTALYLALRQVNDHQDMADISPDLRD